MKQQIIDAILACLKKLQSQGALDADLALPPIHIERTRDPKFGDFACNIAMLLAKPLKRAPRDVATLLVEVLADVPGITKIDIAGPGFMNFYLAESNQQQIVVDILKQGETFGQQNIGQGKRVLMEFVSSNPTGPIHVGHGRSAAYGATLASVLQTVGYDVSREYYVNDAGRQMHILATSIWLRYLSACGEKITFPRNGYQGDYVIDIANAIHAEHATAFQHTAETVFNQLPQDENDQGEGDKEAYIDALIEKAQTLLGPDNYQTIFNTGLEAIKTDIKADLAEFGVTYDNWFSEISLLNNGDLDRGIKALQDKGLTYEKEGALWFRSTEFGDDKDRVLKRKNGQPTYFASDVAYHHNKYGRGFENLIDVFGADHHGYIVRLKAIIKALGHDPDTLTIPLIQFASLYRDGEKVSMSTRSGSFVTLRELREEVGNDAARFFYIVRKHEQHMDFDLTLAKKKSNENPVFYIQYAYARVCSVLRQLTEKSLAYDQDTALTALDTLTETEEKALLTLLARYPEILAAAANHLEPHLIAQYLRELANAFHTYYNSHQFLVENVTLRNARIALSLATRQVIANGLHLLGVSCPEVM